MPFHRKRRDPSEPLPVSEPEADDKVPLSPPDGSRSEQSSQSSPAPGQAGAEDEEQYDLAEPAVPPPSAPAPAEPPPVTDTPVQQPEPQVVRRAKRVASKPKPRTSSQVTQVWNQWEELRLILVVPLALVVLGVVVCTPAFHVLVGVFLTLAGFALTGYLIAISLERPVRVTPEHGVREYFGSLDHHLPNFRRMYLLLTDDAKQVPELDSFRRFQAYWNYRLSQLRPADAGWRPVGAKVKKFTATYNRNRTWARASYLLVFHVRGLEADPVASFEMSSELVKAADGMWYLNEGRIPEP